MAEPKSHPQLPEFPGYLRSFAAMHSAITGFLYLLDLHGRFLDANNALLKLRGLTQQEAIRRAFFALQDPAELAAKLQRQIQEVVETGKPVSDQTPDTSPAEKEGCHDWIFNGLPAAGFAEHLAKPIENTQFIKSIRRVAVSKFHEGV